MYGEFEAVAPEDLREGDTILLPSSPGFALGEVVEVRTLAPYRFAVDVRNAQGKITQNVWYVERKINRDAFRLVITRP